MHIIWTSSEEVIREEVKIQNIALYLQFAHAEFKWILRIDKKVTQQSLSLQKSAKMNSLDFCFAVTLTMIFISVSSTEIDYRERNDKICN